MNNSISFQYIQFNQSVLYCCPPQTFNLTLSVVGTPGVWRWYQKIIVNAAVKVKIKAWTFEAKATGPKAKVIEIRPRGIYGLKEYITVNVLQLHQREKEVGNGHLVEAWGAQLTPSQSLSHNTQFVRSSAL